MPVVILHHAAVNQTIGALGAQAAIAVDDQEYAGDNVSQGFLMKKIMGAFAINGANSGVTADDVPLLCLAYGDSSVTELAAAMVVEQPKRAVDELIDQATVRRLVIARPPDEISHNENDANNADDTYLWRLENFKLPGKGIPFGEQQGWAWFIYNFTGAAFATGGVGDLWARYYGAWLSD